MAWLSLYAYLWPYWRDLYFAISVTGFAILVVFWCIVPESPRWLLINGYPERAKLVINKIAKGFTFLEFMVMSLHISNNIMVLGNGKVDTDWTLDLRENVAKETTKISLLEFFKHKRLLFMTFGIFMAHFTYGFSLISEILIIGDIRFY